MTVQVEALPVQAPPPDRRQSPRFRFSFVMPAVLGRGDALILDISAEGARVMHFAGVPLESQVRLVFFYAGRRFAAIARVLASRVMGLGNGPGGTATYESRVMFVDSPGEVAETLTDIIEHIETERMQNWISNAAGHEGSADGAHQCSESQYFMRCRLYGRRWIKCWTRDASQPDDGFTVPAKLSDGEVDILCDAYEKMDAQGRNLIRVTAACAG
jgi:hypothetical protein